MLILIIHVLFNFCCHFVHFHNENNYKLSNQVVVDFIVTLRSITIKQGQMKDYEKWLFRHHLQYLKAENKDNLIPLTCRKWSTGS